jgi:hypothetical protein
MPKCSCAGNSCSCLVQAGSGVVVTGQGTSAAPYEISIAPSPGTVDFTSPGTLDLATLGVSAVVRITLSANASGITLPTNGSRLDLIFVQDATGGRTVTFPAAVAWPGGTDPVITATPLAADWITLVQAGGLWYGVRAGANLT